MRNRPWNPRAVLLYLFGLFGLFGFDDQAALDLRAVKQAADLHPAHVLFAAGHSRIIRFYNRSKEETDARSVRCVPDVKKDRFRRRTEAEACRIRRKETGP